MLRVDDSSAGKLARCPQCQTLVPIPGIRSNVPAAETASPQPSVPPLPVDDDNPYAAVRAPGPLSHLGTRVRLRYNLRAAGVTQLVCNALVLCGCLLMVLGFAISLAQRQVAEDDLGTLLIVGAVGLLQTIGIVGAISMIRVKSYSLAMAGTLCTAFGGLCCCLLPTLISIYPLVILSSYEARQLFDTGSR